MINHDQAIFDAIAAATDHNDDGIFVDVQKFIDTFNNHRDRKLCTSINPEDQHMSNREIEKNEALARIEQLEASNDQRANDLVTVIAQRDKALARIRELEVMHDEAVANAARWEQPIPPKAST